MNSTIEKMWWNDEINFVLKKHVCEFHNLFSYSVKNFSSSLPWSYLSSSTLSCSSPSPESFSKLLLAYLSSFDPLASPLVPSYNNIVFPLFPDHMFQTVQPHTWYPAAYFINPYPFTSLIHIISLEINLRLFYLINVNGPGFRAS